MKAIGYVLLIVALVVSLIGVFLLVKNKMDYKKARSESLEKARRVKQEKAELKRLKQEVMLEEAAQRSGDNLRAVDDSIKELLETDNSE